MKKLRLVKVRAVVEGPGGFEFDLRGLDGPLLKQAFPISMLSVTGADARELTERARAEGFTVDDDGMDLLIWDSHPSDGRHKISSTNLFIFVLGAIETLSSKASPYLFQFNGLRMQLENGIHGVDQGIETAARRILHNLRGRCAGQLHLSSESVLYLSQAGFNLPSKKSELSISFSDLRDMKDELRKETHGRQTRSRVA